MFNIDYEDSQEKYDLFYVAIRQESDIILTIKTMIDYKKYKQVLDEIHKWGRSDDVATAICELIDQKPAHSIGWFGYAKPMTLWDHLKNAPPVTFPCKCTDKTDCEWYN